MERPKNYAPKEMEGKYSLNVKDNKIVVTQYFSDFNMETTVQCAPEDEFDIAEAVKIAMQRLQEDDKIRVGDTVKIVNPGLGYATLSHELFKDVPLEYAVNYRYGVVPKRGEVGKVVRFLNRAVALVQVDLGRYEGDEDCRGLWCNKPVYCFGISALKKIKDGRFE